MGILAKKVIVIGKNGYKDEYTHVVQIEATGTRLLIDGETEDKLTGGLRHNVWDTFEIDNLHIMIVEFYRPKT